MPEYYEAVLYYDQLGSIQGAIQDLVMKRLVHDPQEAL